jgi:uncharacterized protein YrrD
VDRTVDDHPEEKPGFDILTQWRLVEDAGVVDAKGESLGTVLAFIPEDPEDGQPDYLVVEKGLVHRHRFYFPVDQIADFRDDRLFVKVTEDEARRNGWDKPPAGVDLSID